MSPAAQQPLVGLPAQISARIDSCRSWGAVRAFPRTVQAWYRQQARAQGYTEVQCGSVPFVQRFVSALNLNPHFHVLMLDGVYACREEEAAPVFVPAPPLRDDDIQRIVETAAHRLVRLL